MQTRTPPRIHNRLNALLAMTLQEATDTDLDGVLAHLQLAVDSLFAQVPGEAHEVLTAALLEVAAEYQLMDEMADLALHSDHNTVGFSSNDEEGQC